MCVCFGKPKPFEILIRRRIADNTERKGRGYRKQGGAVGGGLPTILRGKAETIENEGGQRGENFRQYAEEGQRLQETPGGGKGENS